MGVHQLREKAVFSVSCNQTGVCLQRKGCFQRVHFRAVAQAAGGPPTEMRAPVPFGTADTGCRAPRSESVSHLQWH